MSYMRFMLICCSLFVLCACGALPRLSAVPAAVATKAQIPGLEKIRYVVGDPDDMQRLAAEVEATWDKEAALLKIKSGMDTAQLPPAALLALSGGGDKGAYGAGVLVGWTEAGTRPEFQIVTGISTGALIAPFAFLGPRYDARLRSLYTTKRTTDLIILRNILSVITQDALADTAPLRKLLRENINAAFLREVAQEYAGGRQLWISTTNLDMRQRVIWNMTALAASGHPRAVELFHDVMLASAAIPGVFPPVMIQVEHGGKTYQEMHVDGGTTAQVFVYPPNINYGALAKRHNLRDISLYVIMNQRIDPEWAETERRAYTIAGHAVSALINSQGVGDLYRIYVTSLRDGIAFQYGFIPKDFDHPHPQDFDQAFMRALFNRGRETALNGYPWSKFPPGLDDEMRVRTAATQPIPSARVPAGGQ